FFFSSRRRHTRWPRDWSSDVCSSDLILIVQCLLALRFGPCCHFAVAYNLARIKSGVEFRFCTPPPQPHRGSQRTTLSSERHGSRSEERRVGKEGRARWGWEQHKKVRM